MKRNPAAYMANASRHTRRTIETNGKYVRGKRRGRKGVGRGGKVR
jgi:hypothetical protein